MSLTTVLFNIYPVMLQQLRTPGYYSEDAIESACAEYRPPSYRTGWHHTGAVKSIHPCRKSPMFMRVVTMSRIK